MIVCPYCGGPGTNYGPDKCICQVCGAVWPVKTKTPTPTPNTSGSSSGKYDYGSSSSGGISGCLVKLVILFIFMYLGQMIAGSTGATWGLVIGIIVAIFK